MSKSMLPDLEEMSSVDPSAAQFLLRSLQSYNRRGIKTSLIQVSRNSLQAKLNYSGITKMLNLHFECVVTCGSTDKSATLTNAINDDGSHHLKLNDETGTNKMLPQVLDAFFGHIRDALWVIDHYEQR